MVVAQDVGVGFVDVGSEAEFGDKVGVAAFCRVVIGAGRGGAEGSRLFVHCHGIQGTPHGAVSGEDAGGGIERRD